MTPSNQDLWFLPLGGTGEIGMNLNLYGHDRQWLMVDCGVTFDEPIKPNGDKCELVCADPRFISERKEDLAGIVITHAHEDHMGALPYLWSRFPVPVYTTPFTAELLRRKIQRNNQPFCNQIIEVKSGDSLDIGPFQVTWQITTHSLPEPQSLLIETPVGKVFHTADWKIDGAPVTDAPFDHHAMSMLGKCGVDAMVCDSTNALKTGHSVSEGECAKGLFELISSATGKVIVSCFATNIARLITLARIAQRTGRYITFAGHSLNNSVAAARLTGHWPAELAIQDLKTIAYLPDDEILVVATGSQGEEFAAMSRLSQDTFFDLEVSAGDTVIYSAMRIPGNEDDIDKIIQRLKRKKVQVYQAHECEFPIHASGHPHEDELISMYRLVKPKVAIPVHGEAAHMQRHAQIAKAQGIPSQLVGENGDLFKLAPHIGIQRGKIKTGRIAIQR